MKKKIALILLIIVLIGLLCTGSFCLGKYYASTHNSGEVGTKKEMPKSLKNRVVIIYSNVNYAWGFQYSGKVVMGDGSIYEYSLEREDDITLNDVEGLNDKFYDKLEKTDKKISKEDMNKLFSYLSEFDDETTKQKNVAMDAGQTTLDFVNYDDEEIYLIKTAGDFECQNKNDNVDKVVKILKKYGLSVRELGR